MSLPSTPDNKQHDADDGDHPATTPSAWARALGVFSAKKKKTPSTRVNGGFSVENNSDMEDFQSPLSSPANGEATSFAIGTSPTTRGGQKNFSRLEHSSTRKAPGKTPRTNGRIIQAATNQAASLGAVVVQPSAFRNGFKSPRKNPGAVVTQAAAAATTTATQPSTLQGSRGGGKAVVSFRSTTSATAPTTAPTRRYRPNSTLLTGSKGGFRKRGMMDNNSNNDNDGGKSFGQALAGVRDLFLPLDDMQQQDTAATSNIYSTKGETMWGSLDRPSRLPQRIQKRQRPAEKMPVAYDDDKEEEELDNRKKRRKVAFDEDAANGGNNAFTTNSVSATPHRSSSNNNALQRRKATPMPARNMSQVSFESPANMEEEEDDGVEEQSVPSTQRLPSATPPSWDFDYAALDSEEPDKVKLPAMNSYDSVAPSPEASTLSFQAKLQKSKPAAKGLVSTTSRTDYDEKRYERPPSPVRARKSQVLDDGGDGTNQQAPKRSKVGQSQASEVVPDWVCTQCNTKNNNDETVCQGCGNVRTASGTSQGWGTLLSKINQGKWKCPGCNSLVEDQYDACLSCETKKPTGGTQTNNKAPASSNAGLGTAAPAASGSQFTFQAPAPGSSAPPSTGGGNLFGVPSGSTPAASVPGTGTGGFRFEAPRSDKKVEVSTPAPAIQTGGFLFGGTPVPNPSSLSADAKPFEFKSTGNNGDKKPLEFGKAPSSDKAGDNQSGFSFVAASSGAESAGVSFGASSGSATATNGNGGFSATNGNGGSTATNGNGGFPGQFGSAPASEEKPKPKGQRGHDLSGDKPDGVKTPSQVPPTLFGAPAPAAAAPTTLFGAPASATAPASSATFQFGAAENGSGNASGATPAPQVPTPTFTFGSAITTPSAASDPAFTPAPAAFSFVSTGTTPAQAGASFGSTMAPAFGTAPVPAGTSFGSTPAPSFGTAPVPAAASFLATPAPAYGTAQVPAATGLGAAFGTTPAATTGSNATTFGMNATPNPGFGSAPSADFGSTFPPAAPSSAAPAPSVGFGAAGFTAQTPTAASQGFSTSAFGGNAAPSTGGFPVMPGAGNAAPSTGGFPVMPGALNGFGAQQVGGFPSTPAPARGFNGGGFGATAPHTAPPGAGGFNPAPTPGAGGFNIGSSGPKPRSGRRIVRAKRPNQG